MKIAVTGGAGMIGSNFIRFLNKKYPDAKVRLFDDLHECKDRFNNIRDLKFEGSIKKVEDLLHSYDSEFGMGLEEFDFVFHFAANSSTDASPLDSQHDYEMTKCLAQMYKSKLIFASSAGIYGNPDDPHPLSWYALFKKRAEEEVISHGGVAFRLFNVFGPGEEHKPGQNSPFFRYLKGMLADGQIVFYDENEVRDFVPVDVVCEDLHFAMQNLEPHSGKIYDVGTGLPMSFKQVYDYVCKTLKVKKNIIFVDQKRSDQYIRDLKTEDPSIVVKISPTIERKELGRLTQKYTCAKNFIQKENKKANIIHDYFSSFYLDHVLKVLKAEL